MKLKCEAPCQTCYFSGGNRQDFHENDLLWFCIRCKKFYFCEIGLTHGTDHRGGGMTYSCPFCATSLSQEEVDKIIIEKNLVPIGQTSRASHDVYQKLMGSSQRKKKSQAKEESLTAYEHSQISELGDIAGLDIELILEVADMYGIQKLKRYKKVKSVRDLLTKLAKENNELIPFLYSALFKFEEDFRSFQLRFAVFCNASMSEIKEIQLVNPDHERIYDSKLIDSKKDEIWVFVSEKDIDVKNLDAIVQKAFSVDFKEYPKLKTIFLAAPSFSYLVSSTIKKYQSVLTGIDEDEARFIESKMKWRSIPISLWKSEPYKLVFKRLIIE